MSLSLTGMLIRLPSVNVAAQARAALSLTRHECVDPNLGRRARYELDLCRADVLHPVPSTGLTMLFDGCHDGGDPLARRCTIGTVWTGPAMGNA